MQKDAKFSMLSRRQLGLGLVAAAGLVVVGCGGGGDDKADSLLDAFNALRGSMKEDDVTDLLEDSPTATDSPRTLRWENDSERLEVVFLGGYVSRATWTDLDTGRSEVRNFSGGGVNGDTGSLYESFLALRSGMTRAQVIRMVRVDVSQGATTSQVLWIDGQEAMGVRFNGSSDSSTITFAQWGLSIPAGNRNETRTF